MSLEVTNSLDLGGVYSLANTANTTANTANTTANTANTTANTANSTANAAQSTANSAATTINNVTTGSYSGWNTNWTGGIIFGNNVILRGVNSYFKMEGGWQYQNGAQFVGSVAFNGFSFTGTLGGTLSLTNLTTSGSKSFKIADPADSNKTITYYSTEAPKVLLEDRGTATLSSGQVTVTLDASFSRVTDNIDPLKAVVTPMGDCKGLYIQSVAADRSSFVVKECQGGTSNVSFNWIAWATRSGYINAPVVE